MRCAAAGLTVAALLGARVTPALATSGALGASRLSYDVASTLVGREDAAAGVSEQVSNGSGVVLANASGATPLATGIRAGYTVHRYLQTTSPDRYIEQVDGSWPSQGGGLSGTRIALRASDDPELGSGQVARLAEGVEGYEPFVAEGNTYVTDGALPVSADGTVARPAASALSAAPEVSADGETHVHLFYTRAAYPLRVVAGKGVSSVAASGSEATAGDELTVSVRYGRPVAMTAALEGGYENVRWSIESGAAELQQDEGSTGVLAAMPAGPVTVVATASRAEYELRLMGEGRLSSEGSDYDGLALADERLAGAYTYRTGTDLVLPELESRTGRTFTGWAVSSHVEGATPRVEQRKQMTDEGERPYWVFIGEESYGDVTLTSCWDSQWYTLALMPVRAGVELSTVNGVESGSRRTLAVQAGVGAYRTDETTVESARIDDAANPGNWLSGAELPQRVYTVAYDPAGGTIKGHGAGERVEDTHAIDFIGYEGSVVSDGVARRALLIAAERSGEGVVGRVTEDFDLNGLAGGDRVLSGVWDEAGDAFVLPEVSRPGYVFAGWYEGGVRVDLGVAKLVPAKVRTELTARWSPITYRVTYGNLDAELTGDAVHDGGARLALSAAATVPGGGEGGQTTYTVQSSSWVLPEPSEAEWPAGYEFAGYILDVEDGALDERLSSATGVVLAPVTHDGDGRHGGATIGAASHANVRATATWRPRTYAVTLAAPGATAAAKTTTVYGTFGNDNLYLARVAGSGAELESPLAVEPLSGKVLDLPVRSYQVTYLAGAGDDAVSGIPETVTAERELTGYWYTGEDGVARRVIRVETRTDGMRVGVVDDEPFEDVAEGAPRNARELVASWTDDVTLEARWANGGSVALPVPTREGWSFDGWLLGGEGVDARVLAGGEDASFEPSGTTSDITLTAQWSSGPYSIAYDLPEDAVLARALPTRYGDGEPFDLPIPTRAGWRFLGWYGGLADYQDEYDEKNASVELTVDVAVGDLWFGSSWEPLGYHVWLAMPAGQTGLIASTAEGWTAVVGDARAELAAPAGRGVLDVAAGEEALSEVLAAASGDGDGRLGTLAEAAKFVTAWKRGYTAADGDVKLPTPVKAGYTFAGWDLRLAALGADGKPTDAVGAGKLSARGTGSGAIVIEAGSWGDVVAMPLWHRNTYRVEFSAAAPLGADEAVFAGEGGAAAHGLAAMESSAFLASYDVGYTLPASLYERQHSVRFDANVAGTEETTVEAPAAVTGTWDFAGWRLPDGTVHQPGEIVRNLAVDGTAVVEATWNAAGKVTLPVGPQRAGWLFVGWSENAGATADGENGAVLPAGSEYVPERNVTLHAVWERGYRVAYDLGMGGNISKVIEWVMPGTGQVVTADASRFMNEGGWPNPSSLSAEQVSDGEEVLLYSPVIEGWRFVGWFEDGVDLGGVDEPAALSEAEDHVLVARWEQITGEMVITVHDCEQAELNIGYRACLSDGTQTPLCTLNLNDATGNATYDPTTKTLTSKPIKAIAGEYEFMMGAIADRNYVGDQSGLSIETASLGEDEHVDISFSEAEESKLRASAIVVMADDSDITVQDSSTENGLYWIKVRRAERSTSSSRRYIGLQEFKVDTNDLSLSPCLMRYTDLSDDDLTMGTVRSSSLGGEAAPLPTVPVSDKTE